MSLLDLFVDVDDFCLVFLPFWEQRLLAEDSKHRRRKGQLRVSKVMTIIITFHQSHYRDFKAYYTKHVCKHLCSEFPNLVCYERLCGPDTIRAWTIDRLFEKFVRKMHRDFFC